MKLKSWTIPDNLEMFFLIYYLTIFFILLTIFHLKLS